MYVNGSLAAHELLGEAKPTEDTILLKEVEPMVINM